MTYFKHKSKYDILETGNLKHKSTYDILPNALINQHKSTLNIVNPNAPVRKTTKVMFKAHPEMMARCGHNSCNNQNLSPLI